MSKDDLPPMTPSEEASRGELALARAQGAAYATAVTTMTHAVAHDGGETRSGDYLVGYAVEEAEGMHVPLDGGLEWVEPIEENVHVEVVVRDAADGRFIPGLTVFATLIDAQGREIGTHEQPFLWHPWVHHYGRNWTVPGDGTYTLVVRFDAPTFPRHDRENGRRYLAGAEVRFEGVKIATGRK